MELARLVQTWSELKGTRSRLRKTALLSEVLQEAEPDEVPLVVAYLSAQLPQGKIGLGYAAVRKAMQSLGDATDGSVDVVQVDRTFDAIPREVGKGSAARRLGHLRGLLDRVSTDERSFLAGLILGELRQGASEGVMCDAIAEASGVESPKVRRAFMLSGDLSRVATIALGPRPDDLDALRVEVFVPLRPMLAQPAADVQSAIEEHGDGELLFEYKLDGARIQAHKQGDEVRVFSRALNEVTESVPEVVEAVRSLRANTLILDGEAIALREDGRPEPFQTTMRRFGRRRDVETLRRSLPLRVFFFDILYQDGEERIDLPLSVRRERMNTLLPDAQRPPGLVTADLDAADAFWARAIHDGHEGVMAKSLTSLYEAGSRGAQWLKLKPAHTLDLVIVAAEWGSGRRQGWLSNLHLAAYDPESDGFVMLGKTFKGLTDELLEWQTSELLGLEVERDGHVVHVAPDRVVEIAFNDVQQSPRYPGGLALRFARVKRYRPDKTPREADTIETVRAIHEGGT